MAHEDKKERLDRELIELLNELRVALPGVQVLFAFLLTVPFTQRFSRLGDRTVDVFFAAVLLTAVASVLLIAPSAHHRMRFRRGAKEQMIKVANTSALVGLLTLALAIGCSMHVVADLVYGGGRALVVGPVVATAAAVAWFVLPLLYRSEQDPDDDRTDGADEAPADDGQGRTRPKAAQTTDAVGSGRR